VRQLILDKLLFGGGAPGNGRGVQGRVGGGGGGWWGAGGGVN